MFLGTLGKREADAGPTDLSDEERPIVRRQSARVTAQAIAIAVVFAMIAWLV